MMRGSNSNASLDSNSSLQEELELLLLREQHTRRLILEREHDVNLNRSGSAPPTVEGALRAAGNLFVNPNFGRSDDSSSSSSYGGGGSGTGGMMTEEEIRSHPAYLEYYYSNENLNPRLPPPLLSREDWRLAQRIRAAGLIDSGGNAYMYPVQHQGVKTGEEEMIELRKAALRNISRKNSADMLDKMSSGSVGASSSSGMKTRRKSFADILQEGLATSGLSRTASQNSIPDAADSSSGANIGSSPLPSPGRSSTGLPTARSGTHLANNVEAMTSDAPNVPPSGIFEIADIAASLSGLSMSRGQLHPEDYLNPLHQIEMLISHQKNQQQQQIDRSRAEILAKSINYAHRYNGSTGNLNSSNTLPNDRPGLPRRTLSTNNLQAPLEPPPGFRKLDDTRARSQGNGFSGTASPGATDDENLRNINQAHIPVIDPRYAQYLYGRNMPQFSENPSQGRSAGSLVDFASIQALEKAYLEAVFLQQKQQYQSQLLANQGNANDYYVNPEYVQSTTNHRGSQMRSSLPQNEKAAQSHSTSRTAMKGESSNSSNSQSGSSSKGRFESLLDMVKSNKTKSLELSDVLTHVVEFSTDQYGSRFIQQKLETANVEEKMKIFREIIPHARVLMVDVFGNYVIQKFFEHGTDGQRKELARHVIGNVLTLSLQMYGCRVIQKALEVVGVELQAEMVKELDGSVMKCVRDQNGNHVIQKCIECVPQHLIHFITSSFVGHVVILSTHPYGCRVIQRALEHCADPKTQKLIMDEILNSVCNLAQDQYGNYVIQHVLQHGKPHERSLIINKLAGQIVKMSQQKFASNVVEKCLTFGSLEERKLLVTEILGSTDENEPLQAMMKDPFGNYVVQKVLETCDDQNRELLLSRIKVHLTTLKKYTYGKHIVSRVEKLVATGERHTTQAASRSS